jgi:WD40 repeat protein
MNSAKFSRSGRRLVVVEERGVSVWDVTGQERTAKFKPTETLEKAFHCAYGRSDTEVVLKNIWGSLCRFDVDAKKVLAKTEGRVEGCRPIFSADGACIIDGTWEGMIIARDADSLAENFELESKMSMISDLDLCGNALVALRDPLNPDGTKGRQSVLDFLVLVGHTLEFQSSCRLQNDPNSVRWRPDGRVLAVCGFSEINLLDSTGRILAAAELDCAVGALAWSPDGRYVCCDNGVGFSIFDGGNLELIDKIELGMPCAAEFSPDGRFLVLGSGEKDESRVLLL